jgi:hypothetical protein
MTWARFGNVAASQATSWGFRQKKKKKGVSFFALPARKDQKKKNPSDGVTNTSFFQACVALFSKELL